MPVPYPAATSAPPDESTRATALRVGLVGYGLAGTTFHAPFITTTPGLTLAAVVTRDAERRAQAMRAHPGVRVVDSVDALLAQADALDLVVVASPNRSHGPVARAALDAGLGVVVDKPLTPTADEALALVRHARARRRMLTVYQNRRWDGDFVTLQALLREGALGDVHRFETRFERWRPVPKGGWREAGDPAEGGGLLLDLGSHLVDQALLLFGAATHVCAELERRRDGMAVEDDVFLSLAHASGVRTHVWLSAVAAQGGPRFRVLGSRAAWVKHGLDPQEAALKASVAAGSEGWGMEDPSAWGTLGTDDAHERRPTARGDYGGFYAGVVAALRDGAPPPVDPMDAVRTLAVLDAARASARDGGFVRIATPGEP
jgi:predicted dehydrogenase